MDGSARTYIGASTKAYLDRETTIKWLRAASDAMVERPALAESGVQVFVAPSAPLLLEARHILRETTAWVGAQDGNWQSGAATGAVGMDLLADLGMDFVELGHAERYRVFGETADETRRKSVAAFDAGLRLLFCIGEAERSSARQAAEHCVTQIRSALTDIPASRVLLAYEPWWAIGADRPAEPGYVNDVLSETRQLVRDELGGDPLGIVYGGSAGPNTLAPLVEADGLFLGRFVHDPANFALVLDEALARRPR